MKAHLKWNSAVQLLFIMILSFLIPLVAILLVVPMHRARESSYRARCLSHLKQIGFALKQYAADNADMFPWGDIEPGQSYRCFGKLYPHYLRNVKSLTCPSSRDTRFRFDEGREDGEPFSIEQCRESLSYAYGHDRDRPWAEAAPSTTRLAADKYVNADYTGGDLPDRPNNHLGDGRNVLALDGSARWDNNKGPLEADPERAFEGSGDMEHDQTGPDWWSDPPEK